jgi:hypothetical protein
MPDRRDLGLMAALTGVFAVLAGLVVLGDASADVLLAAPLLCLAIPLFAGRYVGEERVHRLARAVRAWHVRRSRRTAAGSAPRRPRTPVRVHFSGLLLGSAGAVRPPPAPLLHV